ncbi:DUF421 domain-containing protein [Texcoconibacillus texcoconensis]|uniref:Uncharacterized membrane protein YcaP (DUF421 family) n=1 Tax=Texcoconibacillus texcoconensis TaxID=1095777 RepID=A0A840QNN4_9BACI|nr:DUF421 domain-containing protein [Texcoconibacillus texcoconensis]MBB5172957.1 uncharacterized membrane protein YcaP (DUF421 family) [Texcoconibacillus texcoconensis]
MAGWQEVILRSFLAIVLLIASARLLFRGSLYRLGVVELVLVIFLGASLAFGVVQTSVPIAHGLIAYFVGVLAIAGILWLKQKSKVFRFMLHGTPVPVVKNGKILEDELKKERLTSDDLLYGMRRRGVFNVQDVEFAMLEPTGEIDVLLKSDQEPLKPGDLNIQKAPVKETETVIVDGKVQDEALARLGFSRDWLHEQLDSQGAIVENAFLAQVDRDGTMTMDLYDDQIKKKQPKEKQQLLASIKSCQAQLEIFSLETENKDAKLMYDRLAKKADQIRERLEPYLKS